jgi:capsular polysaccharide biosynthesis protein
VLVDRLPGGFDEGPGLLASVWRYRWLVAVVLLLGAGAGLGSSARQPVVYESSSQILLAVPVPGDSGGAPVDPDRYVRNQAAFMTSPPVLERAARHLNGRVPARQLRWRVSTEPSQELDMVTVRARDQTPQGAAELANAVGLAYEETAVQQSERTVAKTLEQLQATEAELNEQLAALQARVRQAPGDTVARLRLEAVAEQSAQTAQRAQELKLRGMDASPVALREPAQVPGGPVQPRPSRQAAIGGLLGLVLGAGLAWWLNSRRPAPADRPARPEWPHAAPLLGERAAGARTRLVRTLRSRPMGRPGAPTVTLTERSERLNGHRSTANGSGRLGHNIGHWPEAGGLLGPSSTIAHAPDEPDGDASSS